MSLVGSTFCVNCSKVFSDKIRPCIGACRHSMCAICFDRKLSTACPICKRVDAFEIKNINWQAIGIMEKLAEDAEFLKINTYKFHPETLYVGPCSECKIYTDNLRICVDCSVQSGNMVRTKTGEICVADKFRTNYPNNSALEIIINASCADCCIDGIHKTHKTLPIRNITSLMMYIDISNRIAMISHDMFNSLNDFKNKSYQKLYNKFSKIVEENFLSRSNYLDKAFGGFEILKALKVDMKRMLETEYYINKKFNQMLIQFVRSVMFSICEEDKEKWNKLYQKLEKIQNIFSSSYSYSELDADDFFLLDNAFESFDSKKITGAVLKCFKLERQSDDTGKLEVSPNFPNNSRISSTSTTMCANFCASPFQKITSNISSEIGSDFLNSLLMDFYFENKSPLEFLNIYCKHVEAKVINFTDYMDKAFEGYEVPKATRDNLDRYSEIQLYHFQKNNPRIIKFVRKALHSANKKDKYAYKTFLQKLEEYESIVSSLGMHLEQDANDILSLDNALELCDFKRIAIAEMTKTSNERTTEPIKIKETRLWTYTCWNWIKQKMCLQKSHSTARMAMFIVVFLLAMKPRCIVY